MAMLSSRRHPLVRAFRAAARGGPGAPLLLDGWHLVGDAVAAGLRLRQVVVAASDGARRPAEAALLAALRTRGVPVREAAAPVLAAVSPVRAPTGIVALAERPGPRLEAALAPAPALVLVGVDIQDPGNVGAMVRVAEAAGATGAIFTGASADPYGWKALRAAMGSTLRLPALLQRDAGPLLDSLGAAGLRRLAAVPRGGEPFSNANLLGPVAVLVGGEGAGLAATVLARTDVQLTIPMAAPVESLNVAVAAGLLLYEARRQRHGGRP